MEENSGKVSILERQRIIAKTSRVGEFMSQKPKQAYGGQAVVEGVMFTGNKVYVTAIRRKDNSIEYLELEKKEKEWVNKLRLPYKRKMDQHQAI